MYVVVVGTSCMYYLFLLILFTSISNSCMNQLCVQVMYLLCVLVVCTSCMN